MSTINTKKNKCQFFALVHFFEEKKFSVMKVKDCLPKLNDDYNFSTWNSSEEIEVLWDNGQPYPANVLQFGGM